MSLGETIDRVIRGDGPTPREVAEYLAAVRCDPCAYCGSTADVQLDHLRAIRRGGDTRHWQNLTAACAPCNSAKGERSLLAFLAHFGWVAAAIGELMQTADLPLRKRLREISQRWFLLGPPRIDYHGEAIRLRRNAFQHWRRYWRQRGVRL